MIGKYPALCIVFIFIFCLPFTQVAAQAALPDIAASADSGVVTVSWNSQYSGLKSISILRSSDSINYATIGKVMKPVKGPQTYTDTKPNPGRNFYKLLVVFSSGLNWKTNYCSVYIGKPGMINDTVRKSTALKINTDQPANPIAIPALKKADSLFVAPVATAPALPSKTQASVLSEQRNATPKVDTAPVFITKRINAVIPRFENDDLTPPVSIRSQYIFTDPATGHVDINVPDDMVKHHYSVKFYDEKEVLVTEIPRINTGRIIVDKRNFQRKGIYHFVLRKNALEIEDGYVVVVPNP